MTKKMTLEEMQAELARLKRLVPDPKRQIRHPKPDRVVEEEFRGKKKSCPRCGKEGDILDEFGLRMYRGKWRPQSYCRACRSSTTPHAAPPESEKDGR